MKNVVQFFLCILLAMLWFGCAQDRPFLSGHVKRAFDAIDVNCDPYGLGELHSCLVFSSAFQESLYFYNLTVGEMFLAPNRYFPLKVRVGPTTDDLVKVVSTDERFPFLLAMDRAQQGFYAVRLFKGDGERTLVNPSLQKLNQAAFKTAAIEIDGQVVAVSTFPKLHRLAIFAINSKTGALKNFSPVSIDVSGEPSHIAISNKTAVISDQQSNSIYTIDLSNAADILAKKTKATVTSIDVGTPTDRLFVSRRDLGSGKRSYAILFKSLGHEIKLVDLEQKKVEASLPLDFLPTAAYFPDEKSVSCCEGVKNWFSLASIQGKLYYVAIHRASNATYSLEKKPGIDLTSENNMELSSVHIVKILGGYVMRDAKVRREALCKSNRETYYITSFGADRAQMEAEGHAYSCEGERDVSRFSFKGP